MDLTSGRLLWPGLSLPLVEALPLPCDVDCDVVVLGAGVSGAFSACLLAEAGCRVVVVDRRGAVLGSTPASTALIQYEIDIPLTELSVEIGPERAQAAYVACNGALAKIAAVAAKHSISCDLCERGSVFLARSPLDMEWFAAEVEARRRLGIEAALLSRQALLDRFGIDRPGAIHSQAAMELDPFKLTHGLLRAAVAMGAMLVREELPPWELKGGVHHMQVAGGWTLSARRVVIATGYETPEQFSPVSKHCTLKSTYALATQPLTAADAWPESALLWESGSPYFYARMTADGRIVMGGEDEPFSNAAHRDALLPEKTRTLLDKFQLLRPALGLVAERAWTGTFGESKDGLPLIGTLPAYDGCHFALGFGGNGITFALLAAEITRDAILGRPNPLSKVFAFER